MRKTFFLKSKTKKFALNLRHENKFLPFHDVFYNFVFLYSATARHAAFALYNKR